MFPILINFHFQCFTEENGNGFFDQLVSYQILLDMLYNNGKYDEVIKTFEMIKSRQVQGGKYPKHVIVLVFASCYKQVSSIFIQIIQFCTNC